MTPVEVSVSLEETVDQQLRAIAATWRAAQRPGERLATVKHAGHAQLRATFHREPDPQFGITKTPAGRRSSCPTPRPPGVQPDSRVTAERAHPGRTPDSSAVASRPP
ncbi:MAG: hypothetical protein ACRDRW_09875, partial [Pseudonocardiaceae bacterium]